MHSNSALATESAGSKYNDNDRRLAVALFDAHGSFKDTALHTGIPDRTLRDWSTQEWWCSQLAQLREDNKDLIRSKVSKIVATGYDSIQDRIDNGDEYITKDGSKDRKLVSGRDLGVITGIAFDKLRLIDNQPTSISGKSDTASLLRLKEAFEALSTGRVIEGELSTDIDDETDVSD